MAVTLQRAKPWTPAPWNSGLGLYPEYPHLDAPARYCFIVTTDHPLKPAFSHREGAYSRRTQNERNHRLSTPTLLVRHKPSYVGHLPDVLEEEFRAGGGQGDEAQFVDDQQAEAGKLPLQVEQPSLVPGLQRSASPRFHRRRRPSAVPQPMRRPGLTAGL